MEKEIMDLFTEEVVKRAAGLYGIDSNDTEHIGGFESFVYSYQKDKKDYIMKITHTSKRSRNYIMGELSFLKYLADNGVSVSRPILSDNGQWIEEVVINNSAFLVRCYEKAEGSLPSAADWGQELFYRWGNILGKIHRLSKNYVLSNPLYKRQEWYEADQLNVNKHFPTIPSSMHKKIEDLLNFIRKMPKTKGNYGMIHSDLHHGNFFINKGKITLFDFDDIEYSYFINDIAIVLYYALYWKPLKGGRDRESVKLFFDSFIEGYVVENNIEQGEMEKIPYFLKLRHMTMYIVLNQCFDKNSLSKEQKELLQRLESEIVHDDPIIEYDFTGTY